MTDEPAHVIGRWLAAERLSRIDEADASFRAVFRLLPYHAPSAGFAARVLAAASLATDCGRPVGAAWLRALGGMCLLLAGLAAAALSVSMPGLPAPSSVSGSLGLVARAIVWAGHLFDVGLAAWRLVGTVGQAFRLAAATPQVLALLTANVMLALAAMWGLSRLARPQEERV